MSSDGDLFVPNPHVCRTSSILHQHASREIHKMRSSPVLNHDRDPHMQNSRVQETGALLSTVFRRSPKISTTIIGRNPIRTILPNAVTPIKRPELPIGEGELPPLAEQRRRDRVSPSGIHQRQQSQLVLWPNRPCGSRRDRLEVGFKRCATGEPTPPEDCRLDRPNVVNVDDRPGGPSQYECDNLRRGGTFRLQHLDQNPQMRVRKRH